MDEPKTTKDSFIKFRVSQGDKDFLVEKSKEKGFDNVSSYIRNLIEKDIINENT